MGGEHDVPIVRFGVGQLVEHQLFGYRGVVVDVDATFQLTEDWYREVARSRPPKDRPWYHVLVDGGDHMTYVAEQNLDEDASARPVTHPWLGRFFDRFSSGRYHRSDSLH